jgi:predicted ATPase
VAQLIAAGGVEIPPGGTFLVGGNGSGKSTLVEAGSTADPAQAGAWCDEELSTQSHGESFLVVATHSPLLVALPGAALLERGEWGIRPATYDELELV